MKLKTLISVLLSFIVSQYLFAQPSKYQSVQFVSSSIQDISEDEIVLLDGSKWLSASSRYALPLSEIIIIYNDENNSGIAYIEGDEILVKHLSGNIILSSGYFTKVIKEYGDGAFLVTEDGSYWEVPKYDRYYSDYWLPPYKVLITSTELYMYNLEKNKRIWITRAHK